MIDRDVLSILAVPGRGQDERAWGEFLPRLQQRHEVITLAGAAELPTQAGDVILASSDAASAAVHTASDGRVRALVLLAPNPGEILPDVDLDLDARFPEAIEMIRFLQEIAHDNPAQRSSALADRMIHMLGPELPAKDAPRLRSMIRDSADLMFAQEWQHTSRPAPYADLLSALEVPTLIVAAGEDQLTAAFARALAERAPRGQLVLLDTALRPYPWLAQPDAAAEAVLHFLAQI
jgi:pimeloyl-ACP methyl ester carboxylesterase